ncbi:MAG: hypothetical protein KJZ80_16110 [Hyphomicrobiaceae bacterium]|nr:hypothetical protein [Hyphomicrobiaceae bacterium]
MNNITARGIAETIASLDRTVGELEGKAKILSLCAVEGDDVARKGLAEVLAKIERAKADRVVLENAGEAARERETNAGREADEADRTRCMDEARAHAGKLVEAAARADALVSAFKKALADLSHAESELRRVLSAAGARPSEGVVGQRNIEQLAIERMLFALKGLDRLRPDEPSVADRARRAWASLLRDDHADESRA